MAGTDIKSISKQAQSEDRCITAQENQKWIDKHRRRYPKLHDTSDKKWKVYLMSFLGDGESYLKVGVSENISVRKHALEHKSKCRGSVLHLQGFDSKRQAIELANTLWEEFDYFSYKPKTMCPLMCYQTQAANDIKTAMWRVR